MQHSPYPPVGQSYSIPPSVKRTGFAIQQLQLHEGSWLHIALYFYTDNQRWGLFTDGSRPLSCDSFCRGSCLYVETPGGPDDTFHSSETVKYRLVILRCLACEATNSACDGQTPCDVCFSNAVECFPYSELVDDNLLWSRWTAIPYARIDVGYRFPDRSIDENVQAVGPVHQYSEAVFPSGPYQSSTLTGNHPFFEYQEPPDMLGPSDPFYQPLPINSSPSDCKSTTTCCSTSTSQPANELNTTSLPQGVPVDLQASNFPQKRARAKQDRRESRKKRARTSTSVVPEPRRSDRPMPVPYDASRQSQQRTGENMARSQHQLQIPTPEPDPYSPFLHSTIDLDQELIDLDHIRQDPAQKYGEEFNFDGYIVLPEQPNLSLSPPTESSFSSRSLSPFAQQIPTNCKLPRQISTRRDIKPSSATNIEAAACPGTRTGGGRYDGATYDAPPTSTSLPLRNCRLTAVEILTYLPKHAWSHPDICMRLVDNDWGDSTMADYITITRGRRQLKNSIGKSITGIGKAKYLFFREKKPEELAQLGPEYGTAAMPGDGYASNAFAAPTPRTNPKTTSEWRVKLHRKISRPPQRTLATDGFAPGKSSIAMAELATGVLTDKHPQGFDALDLTRCVQYAMATRGVREWLFPDDWDEVLNLVGGPALVTREHFDTPALARWKAVRERLSDSQLCKDRGGRKRRRDDD